MHRALHELDLNLLVTLHALLEERNVTRAAARIGRSQSSTSHALGRLREVFGDPLLVRSKGGMLATPLAEAIAPQLGPLLEQVERVLRTRDVFSAATTRRRFSIACPDAIGGALTALLGWFEREAPQGRLSLERPPPDAMGRLEAGALDVMLTALGNVEPRSDVMQRVLGPTRFVSLVRPDHRLTRTEAPALEDWLTTPHVQVVTGDQAPNIVGAVVRQRGLARRVGVTVPNFMMALAAVAATDHLFTAPDVVAAYARSTFGLVSVTPPLPLPEVKVGMFWHRRWHQDAGHRWFREGVAEAVAPLAQRL